MEIYDENVLKWGMKPHIESVQDVEDIHNRMIEFDIKVGLGGPYDMPHYRGEQKHGWELEPNILRISSLKGDIIKARQLEKNAWQEFGQVITTNFGKDALRTIFDNEKHGKDWDLLMQAQHAGVKTRLIDWSPTVFAPLYFAVEESKIPEIENSDGQFWVFMVPFKKIKSHNEFPVKDTFYDQYPQTLKEGCMINVSIYLDDLSKRKYETRMFHQKGRFYISADHEWHIPMNKLATISPLLFRFLVPAKSKINIRKDLDDRRINHNYLFGPENPDHQALIKDINKRIFDI
jgi:hypothetical protein